MGVFLLTVTFEDPVDTVYTLLDTDSDSIWTNEYTAKPQIIKTRDKESTDQRSYAQTPNIGWIHISEVSYNRVPGDAFYNSEDIETVVSLKITSYTNARTEEIWSGVEDIRRTNRCRPDPSAGGWGSLEQG